MCSSDLDLNGVYLRNCENPLVPNRERYHPFDGDGMIHSISFREGHVEYRNRFVRTDGMIAEQQAGRALWSGLAESPKKSEREDGWGARTRMKDASSTDVVVHRGVALSSFYQCGDLYRLDPVTLTPVPDDATGELVLTTLHRVGSPLLRYRTGDLVLPRHRDGRLRLVGGILGRVDDMVIVRGVNVYPTAIEQLVPAVIAQQRVAAYGRRVAVKVIIRAGPAG